MQKTGEVHLITDDELMLCTVRYVESNLYHLRSSGDEYAMKIAVAGLGNLGKAVLRELQNRKDFELVAAFSRRKKENTGVADAPVYPFSLLSSFEGRIDVVLNCMGSAHDLPQTTPHIASLFNVVDSFDTHAMIPDHIKAVDEKAKKSKNTALVSVGWDPGLFSLSRLYMSAVMPKGGIHTFWGHGVSQGHTDALKSIDGVLFARQYTVPIAEAVEKAKSGSLSEPDSVKLHRRVCYIVAKPEADKDVIEQRIKEMPHYFKGYQTEVNFITLEDFLRDHKSMAHAGHVIGCRKEENGVDTLEFSLSAASNPALTASVLLAFSKACFKMQQRGEYGCKTVFDVRPADLLGSDREKLL